METNLTRLEQLERAVTDLPAQEFEAFARWFEELAASRWDRRIEQDSAAGRLDSISDAVLETFRKGGTRPL